MSFKTNPSRMTLVLLLSLLMTENLQANDSDLAESWYVGGGFGKSNLSPDGHKAWEITDKKDVSKKIYAGYDITPSVGLEAFWTDFGSAAVKHGAIEDDVKYRALGVNAIYHAPVRLGRIQPFAKLGVAKITTKAKKSAPVNQLNDYDIFGGLGAQYSLTPNWTVRTEYEYFDKDISHLSMGINWRPTTKTNHHQRQYSSATLPAALPNQVTHTPISRRNATVSKKTQRYKTINWVLTGESNFSSGRSQLNSKGIASLSRLITTIKRSKLQVGSALVIGHTDNIGNNLSNQKLSAQRANSVARYLSSAGIPWGKIKSIGRGEAVPIASNATQKGRAKNRRVEIRVQGVERVVVR